MSLITIWPVQDGKILGFLLLVLTFVLTVYYMSGGRRPYIRRVAGLDAIEDAVGRSTEMGKPVVGSYGWAFGSFDYWTVAGLRILAHIAKLCAENNTRLIVPTGGSTGSFIVRPVAVEVVKNAWEAAGRPEGFNENDMPFLSGSQFAMGSGYAGILLTERPGSMILAGSSAADAMMIAETSNQVGAITITSPTYIGNVAALACASDYVMIGEEAIAAGSFLSQDPAQLASIRTQDIFKFIGIGLIILGWVLSAVGSTIIQDILST
jgi:hypothetical protein